MGSPINKDELIQCGAIYIERIDQGFCQYLYEYMEGSEEEIYEQLHCYFKENGPGYSYVDFYYYRLSEQEKKTVTSILTSEEITYIEHLEGATEDIFYPLDEMMLKITAKLTVKEMLFSTFYFTKEPVTIWGNYGRKYPVFRRKIE